MKVFKIVFGIQILAILLGLGLYLGKDYLFYKTVYYPNFGIHVLKNYTVHGIDVSRYQKLIDWKAVKEMKDKDVQLDFVFIKATEGNYWTDMFFKSNWRNAKEHNLIRGAYLYFHPNISGASQAQFFIKRVKIEKGDLPPVVDVEEENGRTKPQMVATLKNCLIALEAKYGMKPIIYCNIHYYKKYLKDDFGDYPFWIAHYGQLYRPRIDSKWHFWQYSCEGNVNGIKAHVDFNVFNGTKAQLLSLCKK